MGGGMLDCSKTITKLFNFIFCRIECVGLFFAYVAHVWVLRCV